MTNQMTLLGDITPKNVVHKIESHKLMNAFPVETGKVIVDGQMVELLPTGTIQGAMGDGLHPVIGVAVTGSAHPAYGASLQHGPVDVTVALKGFAVVYGFAGAAITAKGIKPNGLLDSTGRFAQYIPTDGPDFVEAIALNPAELGELIQILIK